MDEPWHWYLSWHADQLFILNTQLKHSLWVDTELHPIVRSCFNNSQLTSLWDPAPSVQDRCVKWKKQGLLKPRDNIPILNPRCHFSVQRKPSCVIILFLVAQARLAGCGEDNTAWTFSHSWGQETGGDGFRISWNRVVLMCWCSDGCYCDSKL